MLLLAQLCLWQRSRQCWDSHTAGSRAALCTEVPQPYRQPPADGVMSSRVPSSLTRLYFELLVVIFPALWDVIKLVS